MKLYRIFGFVAASLVLAAPISATAEEEATTQGDIVHCSDSDPGLEASESSNTVSTCEDKEPECRPLLQSCQFNSQCCSYLCVLGLCL